MKENELISIIIPVYNCEKYIRKCLESILHQSYQNFEVLIIDNHSNDRSAEMIKEFCQKDERFIYIFNAEGKAGTSRTIGIHKARGDYLSFIDGDDWLASDFLEKMLSGILENDCDICVSGFQFYFENTGKLEKARIQNKIYEKNEIMKELLKDSQFRFYLWNKLFKKSLLKDIRILDMYYEDAVACSEIFYQAERVCTINHCGYFYRRAFSKYKEINMSCTRINDYIQTVRMIRQFLLKNHCYEQYKTSFLIHVSHVYFSLLGLCFQVRKSSERHFIRNTLSGMKRIRKILKTPEEELEKLKNEVVF